MTVVNVYKYSKIPLIGLAQDQRAAKLPNSMDYHMAHILASVLTGNCFVTAPILVLYN
jgi:hypothetical protein